MSIFLELFITFFKIGLFTFGGGYAMLPLIQEEVIAHKWMEIEEVINFIAVSESTPGPFAINIATYVGMETAGFLGAVFATLGVVVPSFVIILIVARVYKQFQESKIVKGCMSGLRPTVIGLIGAAVVKIGKTVFFHDGFAIANIDLYNIIISIIICGTGIFLLFKKKVHPIILVLVSALLGIGAGYIGKLF